jgi:hypothetical protein
MPSRHAAYTKLTKHVVAVYVSSNDGCTRSPRQGRFGSTCDRRGGHYRFLLFDPEAAVQNRACILQEARLVSLYPKCAASIPSDAMRIPCACSCRTGLPSFGPGWATPVARAAGVCYGPIECPPKGRRLIGEGRSRFVRRSARTSAARARLDPQSPIAAAVRNRLKPDADRSLGMQHALLVKPLLISSDDRLDVRRNCRDIGHQ